MELTFRTLRADEIEVRPQQIKEGKAAMLLYIDSRAVVELLNETVGAANWTMDFKEVAGQTVGMLGIWDDDKRQFVYKSDTGAESNIEAQKGLFSDCYKRCLSRWGVDELYSAPKIQIADDGYKNTGYKVSEIGYDDKRNINHLVIVNRFGKEAFRWSKDAKTITNEPQPYVEKKTNRELFTDYCTYLKTQGNDLEELKKFYNYYAVIPSKRTGEILVDSWNTTIDTPRLWESWLQKKR